MSRLRNLQTYNAANPGDAYAHAQMLRLLLAAETIKPSSIELGAYLGHPACKLLIHDEKVKPKGIVKNDKIIKNIEITDYLFNIQTWGFNIIYLAAAALFRLVANNNILSIDDCNSFNEVANLINDFVRNPVVNVKNKLSKFIRIQDVFRNSYLSRNKTLQISTIFCRIITDIHTNRNCIWHVINLAFHFDDEDVKEAIRNEVYPFILGEYL